jgi:transketolase
MAWAWLAERASGPGMLALSRQKLTALERPAGFAPEDVWRGGYAVIEPEGAPSLVLVATGSEVALACETAGKLRADGVTARVVSLPCLELFLGQPESYRRGLIPEDGTPVVAVEAARGESLRRFIGARGLLCGIDRFGASAPIAALAEKFGFTPDSLARRIRGHLNGLSSGA